MENKIVKYDNDINKLSFTGFNQYDIDLFWCIMANLKDCEVEEIVIDYSVVEKESGIKPKDEKARARMIYQMCCKLSSLPWNRFDNETYDFDTSRIFEFKGRTKEGKLYAKVKPEFTAWVNSLTKNFTVFELKELVNLNSKYSKNLYRLLKQWKTTGSYIFHSVDEFRRLLDIPKSYTNLDITQKVIKPVVDDITKIDSFKELSYEVLRDEHKRGKPVVGYRFTWQAEKLPQKQIEAPQEQPKKKDHAKNVKSTKFNNFHERSYDYEDLEKRILNKNKL